MATPQPRTGNPFAPQPSLPASTAIPPSHPVAQTSGSGEEDKQLTATLYSYPPEYPPEPATGYPVYSAGGAFTSSYPHFGQPSGSSPYHPGHAAQSSTPLYTFEQSAPPYQDQPRLQCGGLGTQWVLFIVGWLLWPRKCARERSVAVWRATASGAAAPCHANVPPCLTRLFRCATCSLVPRRDTAVDGQVRSKVCKPLCRCLQA